jgi:nitroreductase
MYNKNMNNLIERAVEVSQRAQRNYDLSKSVDGEDLLTLIYAATKSPSKQNETHYSLYVYTDPEIINEIYDTSKFFALRMSEGMFKDENGEFWQDTSRSVHNSQILSNALFVFVEEHGQARNGNSVLAHDPNSESYKIYMEQINFSIGIAVGELILSASLLGYKTGLCSAFPKIDVKHIIKSNGLPKLLVGIGFENIGVDRRLHARTLNGDLPEEFRNGPPEEFWRFPSFDKYVRVNLNGEVIQ